MPRDVPPTSLAGECLQVLLGRVGGSEAQFVGDLGAGRRGAGALDGALHEVEDLLLAIGQFGHLLHGVLQHVLTIYPVTVFSSSLSQNAKRFA